MSSSDHLPTPPLHKRGFLFSSLPPSPPHSLASFISNEQYHGNLMYMPDEGCWSDEEECASGGKRREKRRKEEGMMEEEEKRKKKEKERMNEVSSFPFQGSLSLHEILASPSSFLSHSPLPFPHFHSSLPHPTSFASNNSNDDYISRVKTSSQYCLMNTFHPPTHRPSSTHHLHTTHPSLTPQNFPQTSLDLSDSEV